MNAAEKIQKLISLIEGGKTVTFSTATRHTQVNLKALNKFRAAGYDLFKSDAKSMYMMQGKNHVCIDYCKITYA